MRRSEVVCPISRGDENSRDAKSEKSDTRNRMSHKSGPKRLRELLQQPSIVFSLGAHDLFTALIVEQADFETVVYSNVLKDLVQSLPPRP
jgi:hypothetical protein